MRQLFRLSSLSTTITAIKLRKRRHSGRDYRNPGAMEGELHWHPRTPDTAKSCHGSTGKGNVSNPNPLHSLKNQTKERFRRIISDGHKAV
ncbi:MAG: hypothetical protein Q7U66_15885 [Methylobacter sp.]|nr:hypothetical protein [Methylobacter sp.]